MASSRLPPAEHRLHSISLTKYTVLVQYFKEAHANDYQTIPLPVATRRVHILITGVFIKEVKFPGARSGVEAKRGAPRLYKAARESPPSGRKGDPFDV